MAAGPKPRLVVMTPTSSGPRASTRQRGRRGARGAGPAIPVRSLRRLALPALVAVLALAACARPSTADSEAGGVDMRVLVKLVAPSTDAVAIAAEASRRAGVPVRYAAAVSPQWHAVSLHCADAATCASAVERLRQAAATYLAVEPDGRKSASH